MHNPGSPLGLRRLYRPAAERGMTLVEAMFAVVISAIAVVGLLTTIVSQGTATQWAREQNLARDAIQQKIQQIEATPFPQIEAQWNGKTFTVPLLAPQAGMTTNGTITVSQTTNPDGSANPNLLHVTATISWKGVYGNESETVLQLITKTG